MEDIIQKEDRAYVVNGYEYFSMEEVKAEVENAKLLYKPEFIPFYLKEVKMYKFSSTEGLVYGFMRFYLSSNPAGKFYFTNEQLAYMLDVSPRTISDAVGKVLECGEFKATYKVKANGGTFRLVETCESDWKKPASLTSRKLLPNNNKIKENKINISKDMGQKVQYGNKDIGDLRDFLKKNYPKALEGITDNRKLWNLRQVCIPRKSNDEWMNKSWKKNFSSFLILYLRDTDEEYLVCSVDKLREKVKLWREYRGKLN